MDLTEALANVVALDEMLTEQATHVATRQGNLQWQPGDIVTVYQDPVSEEKPEGKVRLIEKITEDPPEVFTRLERWEVEFLDDGFRTQRFIKSKGE